jgi:hypothetical protein
LLPQRDSCTEQRLPNGLGTAVELGSNPNEREPCHVQPYGFLKPISGNSLTAHLHFLIFQDAQDGALAQAIGLDEPGCGPAGSVVSSELREIIRAEASMYSMEPWVSGGWALRRPVNLSCQGRTCFRVSRKHLHQRQIACRQAIQRTSVSHCHRCDSDVVIPMRSPPIQTVQPGTVGRLDEDLATRPPGTELIDAGAP